MTTTKDAVKTWLVIEILIAILIIGRVGIEGLAALFCDATQIDDPTCESLE